MLLSGQLVTILHPICFVVKGKRIFSRH